MVGVADVVTGQVYAATVCYNQVMVINLPISKKMDMDKAQKLFTDIASTLKLYNKN